MPTLLARADEVIE